MLFRTLGTFDFIAVLILMGAAILPHTFLLYAALYLIIKGLIFIFISRDFASYGDLFSGIYLLVFSYGLKVPVVHTIVLFYLIQKTILTFIAIGLKLLLFYGEYREELPAFLR